MEDDNTDTYIATIGTLLMVLIVVVFLSILVVLTTRTLGEFAGTILLALIGLAILGGVAYYIYKYYTGRQAKAAY